MSLDYTFHVNSLIPSNSRLTQSSGPDFKARPIKHWRKQLMPNNVTGFSKSTINYINMPGGTTNVIKSCPTCANKNVNFLKTYMPNLSSKSHPQYSLPKKDDAYYDSNLKHMVCRACNPEAHCIKPAVTNISKNYYNNTQAYLKSKDNLYSQNTTLSSIKTGVSGEYYSGKCNMKCDNKYSTTVYKQSNTNYSSQGAVSSGLRLTNLKYHTIKNNTGKYNTYSDTPYYIKSKYTQPKCDTKTC